MQVRTIVGGLLLASGLLSVGCGGTEMEMEESSNVESQVSSEEPSGDATREAQTTVWCTDKSWRVDFYAEPELINRVGWIKCACYSAQTRSGTTTNYTKLAYEFYCSLD
jgi:hypothetical protein